MRTSSILQALVTGHLCFVNNDINFKKNDNDNIYSSCKRRSSPGQPGNF